MLFKDLIYKLTEARSIARIGESGRKERAKESSPDAKARDAARKRQERSRQVPREKKSKQELIKEVILVKTRSGRVQLIFKDSYNKNIHEVLNKAELTIEEAQQAIKDPKFEQTRASQLLFGNVKEKEKKAPKKPSEKAPEKGPEKSKGKPKEEKGEEEEKEQPKAKRLSKDQLFDAMSQMDGNQLSQLPFELRQEYFKMMRKPPSNSEFDNMSYEALSVKFNLSPISNLNFNQQVLNAIMFLAKVKVGAGEQELQTYAAVAPSALEFTRSAFHTAKKILSQLGDECLQNLVSSLEVGGKAVNAEGSVDMACGNYKFKVSAGGEISLSTTQYDQSNKSFRGLVAGALTQALANPEIAKADPKVAALFQQGEPYKQNFATTLIPDELLPQILADDNLKNELQKLKLKDGNGNDIGPIIDEEGQLNPMASLNNYRSGWLKLGKPLLKGAKSAEKSPLKAFIAGVLLRANLRGDNLVQPEMAPNHLITVNGVFPLTDEYLDTIAQTAELDVTTAEQPLSTVNIGAYKPSAAEMLRKFKTVVEAKEEPKKSSLSSILVSIDKIDPMQMILSNLIDGNDFALNASLLPGFKPKDLKTIDYNYLTIGKKTIKIPVEGNERIGAQALEESPLILNDLLIESLTNNFVLSSLLRLQLITAEESAVLQHYQDFITENVIEPNSLEIIYRNAWQRLHENPNIFWYLIDALEEEYKRDYKKEYKNYHGKPKQRKERAARTAARALMIKKGRVKKGDGKDIDHKKPLRNGGSKGINNLRVRNKSENRSDNGHEEGEKQNKGSWK